MVLAALYVTGRKKSVITTWNTSGVCNFIACMELASYWRSHRFSTDEAKIMVSVEGCGITKKLRVNQNKKLINAELDEKNRMPYIGAALEAHLIPTPLSWTELPLTRFNCSDLHWTQPWIPSGMGHPRVLWANVSVNHFKEVGFFFQKLLSAFCKILKTT